MDDTDSGRQIVERFIYADIDPPAKYVMTDDLTPLFAEQLRIALDPQQSVEARVEAQIKMQEMHSVKMSRSKDRDKTFWELGQQMQVAMNTVLNERKEVE
jgi:predicted secreted Zn-dependent protease